MALSIMIITLNSTSNNTELVMHVSHTVFPTLNKSLAAAMGTVFVAKINAVVSSLLSYSYYMLLPVSLCETSRI